MGGRRLRALLLLASTLLLACGADEGGVRELSRIRMCHANMNAICTEMACYRDKHGEWASSIQQLADSSSKSLPLVCPESGLGYRISSDGEGGYRLECPSGHGCVTTGRRSWCEGSGR